MEPLIALSWETNYLHNFIITVLTAAGATDRFSSLLKRWTSAYWEIRYWEAKRL